MRSQVLRRRYTELTQRPERISRTAFRLPSSRQACAMRIHLSSRFTRTLGLTQHTMLFITHPAVALTRFTSALTLGAATILLARFQFWLSSSRDSIAWKIFCSAIEICRASSTWSIENGAEDLPGD